MELLQLLIYGDPHGNFRELLRLVDKYSPKAVIILGDFGLKKPLEQELNSILNKTDVWFIHGNHDTDTDEQYDFLFGSQLADRNLHGRVVDIHGVRVAGVGGVFRGKVWHPEMNDGVPLWSRREDYMYCKPSNLKRSAKRYGGLPRQHNSSIWYEDIERLAEQEADILVTHEAPSCHRHGFSVFDDLAFEMGVKRIFHGHHHESYRDFISDGVSTVEVNGVALAKCKNEQGDEV